MSGRRLIAIIVGVVGLLLLVAIAYLLITSDEDTVGDTVEKTVDDVVEVVEDVTQPEEPLPEGTPGVTPSPTIPPEDVMNMVEVVVAWNTVPRGFQMTEAELAIDERLASEVGSNVITNIDDAIGLFARREIYQGETLTSDSLVRDPTLIGIENYGPSSLVPPGWVALAVPLDRLSSVAYGLSPGDTVDVMLSFTLSGIDEQFQTLLFNSAAFFLPETGGEESAGGWVVVDPYGRFEQIATGDVAHVKPAENTERPIPLSVILQGARVVQVGPWIPRAPVPPPTPTAIPDAPTPTPGGGPAATPTPPPPNVLLLALPPQQQLFLKYALEVNADIDFALRGLNDPQLYAVQEVDFDFLFQQFDITIPPNAEYTIGGVGVTSLESEEVEP
jgi:Flp pilus assembly protein CpaB